MAAVVPVWRRQSAFADGTRATLCFVLIAVVLALPVLRGQAALGPDEMLDFDPLYGSVEPLSAPLPTLGDPTPIALDWPRDLAVARGLRAGRLDLWNPLAACGTPLWAELGGPFFPLKLPFYLFPSRLGYEVFLLLRLAFAGTGAYLLGRRRGLGTVGAIAAGATFELCSFLIYQVRFGVYSNTFVLPWVLLGAEMLAQRAGARAAVGAGVLVGLGASAGHPGIALLVVGAFGAAMLMHVVGLRHDRSAATRCLLWGCVALVIGLALAAPTLLPTADLITVAASYKNEESGADLRSAIIGSWQVALAPRLFLPGFGDDSSALGVLPVIAAVIGILAGGIDPPLLAVGFLGLLVGATPVGLTRLNELRVVRLILPIYAYPLVALPFTQAVGAGVEALTSLSASRLAFAPAVPIVLCLALWAICAPAAGLRLAIALSVTSGPWLIVAATALVVCAALALRRSRIAWMLAPALTIMMIGERIATSAPLLRNRTSQVLAAPTPPAVRLLRDRLADGSGRMVGVPHRVGYPVTPMLFDLADIRGFAALPLRRYVDYLRAVDGAAPTGTVPRSDMASAMVVQHVRTPRSPLLDLAAVRWVAVPRSRTGQPDSLLEGDPDLPLVLDAGPVLVYENRAAMPRVRIAHTVVALADEDAARAWANRTGASRNHARDLGLEDAVAIEPDDRGVFPVAEALGPSADEAVWITPHADPDRLEIGARLESAGVVVIADAYAPGWHAWVDGRPTAIHPANLMFRAVSVPAGQHRIELQYRPRGFVVGMGLFAVSVVSCIIMLAAPRLRSPQRNTIRRGDAGPPAERSPDAL